MKIPNTMQYIIKNKWWLFAGFVFVAALSRLLPHPYNFTPIGGMALFAGGVLSGKRLFWLIPIAAYFISDLLVNNLLYASYYDGFVWMGSPWVYFAIFAIVLWGYIFLRKQSISRVVLGSLGASVLFFLLTNFAVWFSMGTYPPTAEGLILCYEAGIPFVWNTLVGDLCYTSLLFGSYYLVLQRFPSLRLQPYSSKS